MIAVVSAFLGAVSTILARTLLKDIKTKDILSLNFFTMGIVLLLISPLFYHFEASIKNMFLIVLIALIDTAANYFFFKTFEQTEASVASPLLSLAPVFTFFFSWIFLTDTTTLYSIFISFLILALILIFSIDFYNFNAFKNITLWPAVLSSFLFGLSSVPSKYLLSTVHAVNAPTLYMFRAGFISIFSILLFNFTISSITTKQYRIIFFRGLVVISQWVLLYYSLSLGNAGVAITLGNITPIFVFILSIIFIKEKPTLRKMICAFLILVLSLLI